MHGISQSALPGRRARYCTLLDLSSCQRHLSPTTSMPCAQQRVVCALPCREMILQSIRNHPGPWNRRRNEEPWAFERRPLPQQTSLAGASPGQRAGELLQQGLRHDREGSVSLAAQLYKAALQSAEMNADARHMAEALRRLGVLHHRSGDLESARKLCRRSFEVAGLAQESVLAAEALNALGGFALESGEIEQAESLYDQALQIGGDNEETRSHIEPNLGVIANIQGDLAGALAHYECALHASRRMATTGLPRLPAITSGW